jgi:hypothetical protein
MCVQREVPSKPSATGLVRKKLKIKKKADSTKKV